MHDQAPNRPTPKPAPDNRTPESQTLTPEALRSNVRNILLANPFFPKFYADTVIASRPNSKLAKALQLAYPKILDKVKSNMANIATCTHIKVSGVRCGSPALRGEQFCYFHQRMHRGVRTPPQARLHPIANLEDEESIQSALMEVVNALMRNSIDLKRATLILRALHIAVKNASRVRFKLHGSDSVKEIPQFVEPSLESLELAHAMRVGDAPVTRIRTHAERVADGDYHPSTEKRLSREEFLADYFGYPSVEAYRAAQVAEEKAKAEKQNVGTAALGCPGGEAAAKSSVGPDAFGSLSRAESREPGGKEVSVRSNDRESQPTTPVPAHDFNQQQNANDQRPTTNDASPRKPPTNVKEEVKRATLNSAPKARQNAAIACPERSRRAARRG
jgi:hypothetical protein